MSTEKSATNTTEDPMTLNAATLTKLHDMLTNGGRNIDGCWRSVSSGITCSCKDGKHDLCSGWIHPLGGVNECSCPCHDDHRPDYREALAFSVKSTNLWRIGDFVTIDGTSIPWWKITFVDNRTNAIHAEGPDGQLAVAGFGLLNLYSR